MHEPVIISQVALNHSIWLILIDRVQPSFIAGVLPDGVSYREGCVRGSIIFGLGIGLNQIRAAGGCVLPGHGDALCGDEATNGGEA